MRKAIKNTIFGTALVAVLMAAGTAANAQRPGFYGRGYERPIVREGFREGFVHEGYVRPVGPRIGFGVTVGAPVVDAYVPPCPGDGYDWTAGYYDGGIWIPGAWRLRAGLVGGRAYGYERAYNGRAYDRGAYDRAYDRGGFNRGNERGFEHGGERNFGHENSGRGNFGRR